MSCDSSDDETIEHVVLVCGRYELLTAESEDDGSCQAGDGGMGG